MKNALKFVLPVACLGLLLATTRVNAQTQESTSSSQTTTTTTNGAPPPGEVTLEVMPGYTDFGYTPDNHAAHRGYNEGYNKGLSDHDTGHSFRYKDDNSYRHPMGYDGGNHGDYDRVYREAYVHGYQRGYRHAANK